ncbi:MAG: hypothetical protein AB8V03_01310 [Francisella endosymbiont of Hyalomma asiaticum]
MTLLLLVLLGFLIIMDYLQLLNQFSGIRVKGGSKVYVEKIINQLKSADVKFALQATINITS